MEIDQAYNHCLKLANSHYENFPVASSLLPKKLRKPVAAIYAFARSADDFADEGTLDNEERLEKLNAYERELDLIEQDIQSGDPVFIALKHTINHFNLPILQFRKLLSAFRQDVTKKRYKDFNEILDYCDRSANPVGHLLLSLVKKDNDILINQSNSICTALQLINFLQDINIDFNNDRIYLPMDEMEKYGIKDSYVKNLTYDKNWHDFIAFQLNRAERLLREGSQLGNHLGFRLGTEINLTVAGGMRVLKKLNLINENRFIYQARLSKLDWIYILISAINYPGKHSFSP